MRSTSIGFRIDSPHVIGKWVSSWYSSENYLDVAIGKIDLRILNLFADLGFPFDVVLSLSRGGLSSRSVGIPQFNR